ncbi:hypothetical protein AGOR_G00249060 [Albula goreensis]|uniref:Uncharacterized protein n=1 Tax=Albula goreensis TaxID=1534307 RepID=A0A8T3CE17_9TELE|nr:hypothetical protein AGOR_G00249060 [Albula goreensis]
MERRLPKIVLRDGTSAPFQLLRRRVPTDKLPVLNGVRVSVSRGKLGDTMYKSTTDFLRTGPCMRVPEPHYNNLHDPHLRHFFNRKDKHQQLLEANFITEDNEVICSLKEYNTYEEYLRNLKMIADRTKDGKQRAKMEKVIRLQEKGRIPKDVKLAEVVETLLEEDSENLQYLLEAEQARNRQVQTEEENDIKQSVEDLFTKLDLLSWKAEDRNRLMLYEKQYRHQQNRDRYLKEVQDHKDQRNQSVVERKCSKIQKNLQEKIDVSQEAEFKRLQTESLDKSLWEPAVRESQCLLPKRLRADRPVLRSGPARVYGIPASETFQKLPAVDWRWANRQRKLLARTKISEETKTTKSKTKVQDENIRHPTQGESQHLLPLRPRMERPKVQCGPAKLNPAIASETMQKPPVELGCRNQHKIFSDS